MREGPTLWTVLEGGSHLIRSNEARLRARVFEDLYEVSGLVLSGVYEQDTRGWRDYCYNNIKRAVRHRAGVPRLSLQTRLLGG